MNAFYQIEREQDDKPIIRRNDDYSFDTHYHSNIEVLVIKDGKCEITSNGKTFEIGCNTVAVFDSYDLHGFRKINKDCVGNCCVVVFPEKYQKRFNSYLKGNSLSKKIITSERLCDRLLEIVDRLILDYKDENILDSALDLFLAVLVNEIGCSNIEIKEEKSLIKDILHYIEDNLLNDISLPKIAKGLGYSEAHISRIFHHYMGVGLPTYINERKIKKVKEYLRDNPNNNVTEAIFECGFKSVQSYYRNLKKSK